MSPDAAHAPVRVKFDAEAARREFPILAERIHDKPLVYLDNANTTQKPKQVLEALDEFYRHQNANIHRATHQLSERATAAYEGARAKIARFIGARETGEIVLTKGCTDSLNLVAQSFARPRLKPGDEILVTWLEHHSNIVPWQLVAQVTGAKLHVVPIDESGDLRVEDLEKHLTGRTKIVSVTHISNALGTILPVREIVELAHDRGIPTVVDGAQ